MSSWAQGLAVGDVLVPVAVDMLHTPITDQPCPDCPCRTTTQGEAMSSEPRQCVCCGLGPIMWFSDGPCGHPFCSICVSRGHDEDCVACESGVDGYVVFDQRCPACNKLHDHASGWGVYCSRECCPSGWPL